MHLLPFLSALLLPLLPMASASTIPIHDNISSVVQISFTCPSRPSSNPNVICGGMGTLSKPAVLRSGKASALNKCAAACASLKSCVTFGYTASTKMCTLYRKTLPNMGFVRGTSSTTFYNHHCFDCQPTTTTTTSSSSQPTSTPPPVPTPCGAILPNIPFKIQVASVPQGASNSNPNNFDYDEGYYVDAFDYDGQSIHFTQFNGAQYISPSSFTFDEECHLVDPAGRVGLQRLQPGYPYASSSDVIDTATSEYVASHDFPEPKCAVAAGTNAFTCVGNTAAFTTFFTCFGGFRVGQSVPSGCEPVKLVAILG